MSVQTSSVFTTPTSQLRTLFDDYVGLATFPELAVRTVYSLLDAQGVPQSMVLGATSNMMLEAVNDANMFVGSGRRLNVFETTVGPDGKARVDVPLLGVAACNAGSTVVDSGSNALHLRPGDSQLCVRVGSLGVYGAPSNAAGYVTLAPTAGASNGLRLAAPVYVDNGAIVRDSLVAADLVSGNSLYVRADVFGSTFNVYKNLASSDTGSPYRLGYALRINAKDQLEMVRYGMFTSDVGGGSSNIVQRVAVFGANPLTTEAGSDSSYIDFNSMSGVSIVDGSGSGSNAVIIARQWLACPGNTIGSSADIYYGEGDVGVGTSNPEHPLHVVGNIYATGDLLALSDARYKSDLLPIAGALDRVEALTGYTFVMDGEAGGRRTGLIAQEVQEVMPEVVVAGAGGHLSVAYGNLAGLFVQAIKELSARVAALEGRAP